MKKVINVCIIILNWNGLKNTKICLDSVLRINFDSYKIILVDNGSRGNDYEVFKKSYGEKIDIYRLNKNLGFTGGVNFGLKIAQKKYHPDYYLLLNNDTTVDKNFLHALIQTAYTDKNIGIISPIIYSQLEKNKILYSGGKIMWPFARPIHKKEKIIQTKIATFVTGCCFLISKELLEKNGLFDERFFAYFEDTAYCLLTTKAGYKCVVEPKAIVYHQESSSLGKKSKTYTYLFSRNRILFINNYTPRFYRIYFFFFNFLKLILVESYFFISHQNQRASAYLQGYLDGNRGIGGEPKL